MDGQNLVTRDAMAGLSSLPHYECSGHINHFCHKNFCFSQDLLCLGLDAWDWCGQTHYSAIERLQEYIILCASIQTTDNVSKIEQCEILIRLKVSCSHLLLLVSCTVAVLNCWYLCFDCLHWMTTPSRYTLDPTMSQVTWMLSGVSLCILSTWTIFCWCNTFLAITYSLFSVMLWKSNCICWERRKQDSNVSLLGSIWCWHIVWM